MHSINQFSQKNAKISKMAPPVPFSSFSRPKILQPYIAQEAETLQAYPQGKSESGQGALKWLNTFRLE